MRDKEQKLELLWDFPPPKAGKIPCVRQYFKITF